MAQEDASLLELRINNPFATGNIFEFDEGDFQLDRKPMILPRSIGDRYYTTVEGNTLGQIANEAYGNSKWWWVIYDNNLDLIPDPFALEAAITLIIPDFNLVKIQ